MRVWCQRWAERPYSLHKDRVSLDRFVESHRTRNFQPVGEPYQADVRLATVRGTDTTQEIGGPWEHFQPFESGWFSGKAPELPEGKAHHYLVKYEVATHDSETPSEESQEFSAGNDRAAYQIGHEIADRRREHLGGSNLCHIERIQILRAEYFPI